MSKELLKPQQYCKAEPLWEHAEYTLSPEEQQALGQLYEEASSTYKRGGIVTGIILSTDSEGVRVDINFKSEGLIGAHEFTESELKKLVIGAPIDVILEEFENADGNIAISYQKAKALRAWEAIMNLYAEGKPVEGVVAHKVKGGLSVDIGVPAFLPGSQVDVQRVSDFDQYVGQTITAYILKVNPRRGNVIISRRKFLNEQRSEVRKKILETLEVGQIIQGVVKNITNYGAFVDIGGVDGLLHITDMTWGRISHPSELLQIGETITVKVLSFDKLNEKISLGLKQLEQNPWEKVSAVIQPGSKIKGIIASITDYGLFIEVAKGVEGLVHISEISWSDRISDLHKFFKVGDEVEVIVVSLDKDNRRMSLSIKQLEQNPWDAIDQQYTIGQQIRGKITNITDFGIFVQIIPGVDGLVHVSDISWTEHIKNPIDIYNKGDEVDVVITDINKSKKKISLSIKHLAENPWETLEKNYSVGSMVEGEVMRIADIGAFIKLPTGVEGFLHISEASDTKSARLEDVLKVGQIAQFRVIKINQDERKIGLSLRSSSPEAMSEETKRESFAQRTSRKEVRPHRRDEPVARPKSQLQLELEKHAARLNENKDDTE